MDITQFLPTPENFVLYLVTFVIALSIIVAVHEYGHYIVGRWSGIKADVFSLGFGPVLWSRMDKRGTKWQIAALPFGGYVKFMGDANAASAGVDGAIEEIPEAERRHTMQGAPLWARTLTVAAGPFFNFFLSILVFGGLFFFQGKTAEPLTVADLRPLPQGHYGVRVGDELLAIDGQAVPSLDDDEAFLAFRDAIPMQQDLPYTVRRDGQEMQIEGPYPWPPLVSRVTPRSAAFDIGLEQGDVITSIDGTPVFSFKQLQSSVEGGGGKPLLLGVWRPGEDGAEAETLTFTLVPKRTDEPQADGSFKTNWRIGVASGMFFEGARAPLGLGESAWGGVRATWSTITTSLSGLWHLVTGAISSCNMSGPIGIAEVSGAAASQGLSDFILFIAGLSTAVGLLNLFPIPVLDGGHLVFYAYEAVAGKPPSDKVLNVLMALGLAVLLSVMLFALSNDVFCP